MAATGRSFLDLNTGDQTSQVTNFIEKRVKEDGVKPKPTISNLRRAITYALAGTGIKNPFEGDLLRQFVVQIVKQKTKSKRRRKGVIDVGVLLVRFLQVYGIPSEEKPWQEGVLRIATFLSLGLTRMFRTADIYAICRDEIRIKNDGEYMLVEVFGNKIDSNREGSTACIWSSQEKNPFCPVRLWRQYEEVTREKAELFKKERQSILRKMGDNMAGEREAEKFEERTPLFYQLGKPATEGKMPFRQASMTTQVKKVLGEVRLKTDRLDRSIKPGSIQKSGRMAARAGGFTDAWLDAIGNWSHQSVGREYYEDFMVPRNTTDVILNSETVMEQMGKGIEESPLFAQENMKLWTMVNEWGVESQTP